MSDPAVTIREETRSSVEVFQNAKQEFGFSIKVFEGDVSPDPDNKKHPLDLAREKAVEMAVKTMGDIKSKLRPAL